MLSLCTDKRHSNEIETYDINRILYTYKCNTLTFIRFASSMLLHVVAWCDTYPSTLLKMLYSNEILCNAYATNTIYWFSWKQQRGLSVEMSQANLFPRILLLIVVRGKCWEVIATIRHFVESQTLTNAKQLTLTCDVRALNNIQM